MSSEELAIRATGVHFSYGQVQAVRNFSISVRSGDVIGLVGLNGAGKTTSLYLLSGVLRPHEGRVLLGGADPWGDTPASLKARAMVGLMPDSFPVYGRMTGWEYLDFVSLLHDMPMAVGRARASELAEDLGLGTDILARTTSGYSTGMKRKLMLIASDLHRPSFLLLDEPTSGLDPDAQLRFRKWLAHCRARGAGVLLSSHSLSVIADCCTAVAIMHRGQLVAEGTLQELARAYGLQGSEPEQVFFAAIGTPTSPDGPCVASRQ